MSNLDATLNRLNEQMDRHLGARQAQRPVQHQQQPTPHAPVHPFEKAAAEIARRKQSLNTGAAMPDMPNPAWAINSTPVEHPRSHVAPAPLAKELLSGLEKTLVSQFGNLTQKLEGLKNEMNDLRGLVQTPVAAPVSDNEELDRIAAGVQALQQAPQFDPVAFDALSQELEQLRQGLDESVKQESWETGYTDIAHRLDRLSNNNSEEKIGELGTQLDDIRNSIEQMTGHLATDTDQEDRYGQHFDSLHASIEQLNSAFEDKTQALASTLNRDEDYAPQLEAIRVAIEELNQEKAEFTAAQPQNDEFAEQIASLQTSLNQMPQNQAMDRLESRLHGLAEVVELMAKNSVAQPGSAVSGDELGAIEARLDEITRAIVAVSRPAEGLDVSALDRLETRMAELASMVEVMAEAPAAAADPGINLLAERIEGLNNRLGDFEQVAAGSTGDMTLVSAPQPDMSGVEAQLAQLAARLDEAVSGNSTANQISNLENQISSIAGKLNEPQAANVDFAPLEARLGQIETRMANEQDTSLEAIQKAAQSAVEMMSRQSVPDPILSALARDLKDLQIAAETSDVRTSETFQSVQETLQKVATRLSGIEQNLTAGQSAGASDVTQLGVLAESANMPKMAMAEEAAAGLMASEQKIDASMDELVDTMATRAVVSDEDRIKLDNQQRQVVDAPSLDPTDYFDDKTVIPTDLVIPVEDHRPLEPGSDAPDIAELVKKASEKLNETQDAMNSGAIDSGKTDFVAAARRAAQAAAADVGSLTEKSDSDEKSDNKSEKKSKNGRKINLKLNRKPLVIAAGAVLMAIIALAGSKLLWSGRGDQTAMNMQPAAIERVENTAAMPASPMTDTMSMADTNMANSTVRNVGEGVTPPAMSKGDGQTASGAMMASDSTMSTPPAGFTAGSKAKNPNVFKPQSAGMDNGAGKPEKVASAASSGANKVSPPASGVGPAALREAAAKGDMKAQFEIGLRYTEARGVKRDLKEAAKWYQYSAAQGFAPGQYRLGSLYEKGVGVKRDVTKAAMWYARAAEQGNARAMHNLAVISAMGTDGKTDMPLATKWFQEAARLGVKDSQFNLGILFGQGMGLPQDLKSSYKWFALAAKTGDSDAAKKRDEVANAMDPGDLEKARVIVSKWRPGKLTQAANRVVLPEEWRTGKPARSASAASKPAQPTMASVKAGSSKSMVMNVQSMLNKQGFNVGRPDGVAGPKTRRAIMAFQQRAGLPITGKVDNHLVTKLQEQSI